MKYEGKAIRNAAIGFTGLAALAVTGCATSSYGVEPTAERCAQIKQAQEDYLIRRIPFSPEGKIAQGLGRMLLGVGALFAKDPDCYLLFDAIYPLLIIIYRKKT